MTHTPGPWFTAATPNIECPAITDANGWMIAPRVESVADARLIASAPELLAALERCAALLGRYPKHDDAWNQARAAIAKATGE